MVEASGTNLTAITGISTLGAARILAEVGDVRRFASENHFASATGTAPVRPRLGASAGTGSIAAGTDA
jgi:transposase